MTIYKPTYLYIKEHSVTKLKYFGKTTKDPEIYLGSGKYWKRHIKKYGKEHVVNIWYCLFFDKQEIIHFANTFSILNNITESDQWANLCDENGTDGGDHFSSLSDEQKKEILIKISRRSSQQVHSLERRRKSSERMKGNAFRFKMGNPSRTGQKQSPEERKKKSDALLGEKNHNYGKSLPEWQRQAISLARRNHPKLICPHCELLFDPCNFKRWHGDNCKLRK